MPANDALDRAKLSLDRERFGALCNCGIRIFQSVSGQSADNGAAPAYLPEFEVFQQACKGYRGCRLAENTFGLCQQLLHMEDFLVSALAKPAARLLLSRDGLLP